MRKFAWLALLITVSAPALAADGRSCLEQSVGLSGRDRTDFLKGCLGQNGSPANAEETSPQSKRLHCEQNAKSQALQGKDADRYIEACLQKNREREARMKMAESDIRKAPDMLAPPAAP